MTDPFLETRTPPPAEIDSDQFRFGPQQGKVIRQVEDWLARVRTDSSAPQIFRLFGVAGTGKTTLARHLAASLDGPARFCAFTGKAALMMQRAGCPDATTIHGLIYTAHTTPSGGVEFRINPQSPARGAALIVVDECSMVDETIGRHLMSFGAPILVLGDPAQLPPIKGKGFFTEAQPDAMLTEIHRQARGNPIIRIATAARKGEPIPYGEHGTVTVDKRGRRSPEDALKADQIIVGRNTTRTAYNAALRRHLGRTSPLPVADDRLVCLRNDTQTGLLNGTLFTVLDCAPSAHGMVRLRLRSEDGMPDVETDVHRAFFEGGTEKLSPRQLARSGHFDYGFALTGHKSQGSQWADVLAYDESGVFGRHAKRWLYTVITRAQERLTLIR